MLSNEYGKPVPFLCNCNIEMKANNITLIYYKHSESDWNDPHHCKTDTIILLQYFHCHCQLSFNLLSILD